MVYERVWCRGRATAKWADARSLAIVEDKLTAWMHQHLRVVAIPFKDADTLGELESEVLRALDPPLNLDKVTKNPLRVHLTKLRRRHGRVRLRVGTLSSTSGECRCWKRDLFGLAERSAVGRRVNARL